MNKKQLHQQRELELIINNNYDIYSHIVKWIKYQADNFTTPTSKEFGNYIMQIQADQLYTVFSKLKGLPTFDWEYVYDGFIN